MSNDFNVNEYWLKRGRTYLEERLPQEYHRLQERFLFDVLLEGRIPIDRILELGCGFGRITRLLADNFPTADITALDLSPDQIENARRYCGERDNVTFGQYDFYSGLPIPGTGYDAAVAVEVFLHHPQDVLLRLFGQLKAVSRYIINVDWSEEWPWETPEHVWVHDYRALYGKAGWKCVALPMQERIDGMQQQLFVAGAELTPELLALDQTVKETTPAAPKRQTPQSLSQPAQWLKDLQLANEDLRRVVPRGKTIILVNDNQWGNEQHVLPGRRVWPFLERGEQYWGPPADDPTAIRELQRMRQAGATHMVFAWSSFWWLEHYDGLQRYLQDHFPCVLRNERLVVFKLD